MRLGSIESGNRTQIELSQKKIHQSKIALKNRFFAIELKPGSNAVLHISRTYANEQNLLFGFICIRFGSCEAQRLTLGVTNKLFDSLFLPILQYGSEVWGIYDKENFNTWEKDDIEKTHMYFCKQFLGVNKQCANVATRYELGRLPIKLAIETSKTCLKTTSLDNVYNSLRRWLIKTRLV